MITSSVPRIAALISHDRQPGTDIELSIVNFFFRMKTQKQYIIFNIMRTKINHCGPILLSGRSLKLCPKTLLFGISSPANGVMLLSKKVAIMRGIPSRSNRCLAKLATPRLCTELGTRYPEIRNRIFM